MRAALAVLLLACAGLTGAPPSDPMPDAWRACVAACERESPADRGQGCIDVECNPLLDDE
jgi:hypothetical protein